MWLRIPVIHDHPVEILLLSENEPVPNNSVVSRQSQHVTVNNRFSCISSHTDASELGICRHEESDIMMILRPNGHDQSADSVARSSTKGSSRQLEQVVAREMV
jgi:hypothetical protein